MAMKKRYCLLFSIIGFILIILIQIDRLTLNRIPLGIIFPPEVVIYWILLILGFGMIGLMLDYITAKCSGFKREEKFGEVAEQEKPEETPHKPNEQSSGVPVGEEIDYGKVIVEKHTPEKITQGIRYLLSKEE
jgi:mannose/fructose/N-acetylgalactosamine-specific phosphotransferase system component IIC